MLLVLRSCIVVENVEDPLAAHEILAVIYQSNNVQVQLRAGGVAALVLTNPAQRNALSQETRSSLACALGVMRGLAVNQCRVAVMLGAGPVFCAGAHLDEMRLAGQGNAAANAADAQALAQLFFDCASLPMPVVAVVQGAALGGGLGLVACADEVIAHQTAVFGLSEVRLGLVPGVISPFILRKIPLGQAGFFMMSGERFDAPTAQAAGLVSQVALPGAVAQTLATTLACYLKAAPEAARRAKALLLANAPLPLASLVETCVHSIAAARAAPEAQEGIAAFFERRSPAWVPGVTLAGGSVQKMASAPDAASVTLKKKEEPSS